jgi:hypothetical protein
MTSNGGTLELRGWQSSSTWSASTTSPALPHLPRQRRRRWFGHRPPDEARRSDAPPPQEVPDYDHFILVEAADTLPFRSEFQHSSSLQELSTPRAKAEAFFEKFVGEKCLPYWIHDAQRKVAVLKNSNHLILGDDVGINPPEISKDLESNGLLSLRVERFPRNLEDAADDYVSFPYLYATSPSTPETSSLRG